MTEETQFLGVHVSPGSTETLVRRGGIRNYRLLAYSLSNVSAKNYENRLMCVEIYSMLHQSRFLRHSVYTLETNLVFGHSFSGCDSESGHVI